MPSMAYFGETYTRDPSVGPSRKVIKRGNKTKVVIGQSRRPHSRPAATHRLASHSRSHWEEEADDDDDDDDEWASTLDHRDRASTRSDYHTVADLDLNLEQDLADRVRERRSRGRSRPKSVAGTPFPRSRASSVYPESVYHTPYTAPRRGDPSPRRRASSYYPESAYESSYPPTVADGDDYWDDEAGHAKVIGSRTRPASSVTIEPQDRGRRVDNRRVHFVEDILGVSEPRRGRSRPGGEIQFDSLHADRRGRVRAWDEVDPLAFLDSNSSREPRKAMSSDRISKHERPNRHRKTDEAPDDKEQDPHASSDRDISASDDSSGWNSTEDSGSDESQQDKGGDQSRNRSSRSSLKLTDEPSSSENGSQTERKRFRQVRWDISDDDTITSADEDPFDELDFAKFMRNPNGSEMVDSALIDASARQPILPAVNFEQLNIQRSRWVDGSLADDKVVAEITLATNSTSRSQDLMKWIHLEREQMVFEEFISVVQQSIQGLKSAPQVLDLLHRTRNDHESQRQYGRDMNPVCAGEFNYDENGEVRDKMISSVIFLSIPYMKLEEYSGSKLRSLQPGSPIHPARGIVHAFTNVCDDRRELEQAIHRAEDPSRNCLHKSNLWCLVVDDELIVTCSRLSLAALMSNQVKTVEHPPNALLQDIQISLDSRSWKIPRAAVDGWPALLALFSPTGWSGFADSGWEFRTGQGQVNAQNWTTVIDNAAEQSIRLSEKGLEGVAASAKSLYQAASGRVHRQGQRSTKDARGGGSILHQQDFQALGLFQYPSIASGRPLSEWAGLIHDSLLNEGKQTHRKAYFDCPMANAQDIIAWMKSASKLEGITKDTDPVSIRRQKRQLVKIAVLVVNLCQFFWPSDFEHVMIQKTYGALLKFLKDQSEYDKVRLNTYV